MGNTVVIIVLLGIVALAVYGTVRRIRYGSSCCGEKTPPPKKIKVKDRNKASYPFTYRLKVDGMHCSNCARRVENALNSMEGSWATVDLGNKEVTLLRKSEATEQELTAVIAEAGYTVLSVERIR
jgi:copper chaperone CopZ